MHELLRPFGDLLLHPMAQWHPLVVHFPIAFLVAELALLIVARVRGRADIERQARACLLVAAWTMPLVIVTGLHDSGLDLGDGSRLLLGIADRWKNRLRWQSSITVHVWLALALVLLTCIRFALLRLGAKAKTGSGRVTMVRVTAAALGIWLLAAAAYGGGHVSHK